MKTELKASRLKLENNLETIIRIRISKRESAVFPGCRSVWMLMHDFSLPLSPVSLAPQRKIYVFWMTKQLSVSSSISSKCYSWMLHKLLRYVYRSSFSRAFLSVEHFARHVHWRRPIVFSQRCQMLSPSFSLGAQLNGAKRELTRRGLRYRYVPSARPISSNYPPITESLFGPPDHLFSSLLFLSSLFCSNLVSLIIIMQR